MPVKDINKLIDNRVEALRVYHKETGVPRAELDVSGGADSAAMAGLLVLALGPENCTFVHSRINTNPEQTARAHALVEGLGARLIDIDLTRDVDTLVRKMLNAIAGNVEGIEMQDVDDLEATNPYVNEVMARINNDPTILGSIRSCIRAPIGRGFNRMMGNGIRHGTGNECEDRFLRYYQKGGDGEVDTNPIEMLSKSEVYQLLWGLAQRFPNASEAFKACIKCKPSADLWGKGDEQTDEGELRKWLKVDFTYGRVDPETGEIQSYGTIERVNRFLDVSVFVPSYGYKRCSEVLFGDNPDLALLCAEATKRTDLFAGFSVAEIGLLLGASVRAEKATRHKANGNIPMLGSRRELVYAGILSNDLD